MLETDRLVALLRNQTEARAKEFCPVLLHRDLAVIETAMIWLLQNSAPRTVEEDG